MSMQDYKDIWVKSGRPTLWEFVKTSALFLAIIVSIIELLDSYLTLTFLAGLPEEVVGQMMHNTARTARLDWALSVIAASVIGFCASMLWSDFKRRRKLIKAAEAQDSVEASKCSPSK
jgi:membrane protein implicated in regulation of membrane protease activity